MSDVPDNAKCSICGRLAVVPLPPSRLPQLGERYRCDRPLCVRLSQSTRTLSLRSAEEALAADGAAVMGDFSAVVDDLRRAIRASLPPYNPIATGCVADGCRAAFDAPPTVAIGDVLTCPACGSRTQVIDLGRDPERIEYIRARSMSEGEEP